MNYTPREEVSAFVYELAKRIIIACSVAFLWLSIILHHTGGGLLIGGDWPGDYEAFASIRTGVPYRIVNGMGLLLAGGNIYSGFYIGAFMGMFFNLLTLFLFLDTLLQEWKTRTIPKVVVSVLYAFNMISIYNTFKSVMVLADIYVAGFLLFLTETVVLYNYIVFSHEFTKLNCILMGIGVAISSRVPPNCFRILPLEFMIVAASFTFALIRGNDRKLVLSRFFAKIPLIVAVAMLGMLYWEVPFFSSLHTFLRTAFYAAEAHAGFSFPAPYATLINVFRMLGVWVFTTEYCPYHDLYFNDPLLVTTSLMWPAISLGLAYLLSTREQRSRIGLLVSVSILIISWDVANNPPTGALNVYIASHTMVLGRALFPTSYLSGTLLPIFYTMLSGYAICRVIDMLQHRSARAKMRGEKFAITFLLTLLTAMMMVALIIPDMPFFSGEAVGQYFDPSIRGIWIPDDYYRVKSILSHSLRSDDSVLLWPSITFYFRASWGYQGTNLIYNNFFSPFKFITPDYMGPYALYNPELKSRYFEISRSPLGMDSATNITGYVDLRRLWVSGANYLVSDRTVKLDFEDNANHTNMVYTFRRAFKAPSYQFLVFRLRAEPKWLIEGLLRDRGLWIGIRSPMGTVAWHAIGDSTSGYSITDNETIIFWVTIGLPNKPSASSSIMGFNLRIFPQRWADSTDLSLDLVSIEALPDIDRSIFNLWKGHGVKYIMIDKSIVEGMAVSPSYYSFTTDLLVSRGMLVQVFTGEYIQLYRVNYGT